MLDMLDQCNLRGKTLLTATYLEYVPYILLCYFPDNVLTIEKKQ